MKSSVHRCWLQNFVVYNDAPYTYATGSVKTLHVSMPIFRGLKSCNFITFACNCLKFETVDAKINDHIYFL